MRLNFSKLAAVLTAFFLLSPHAVKADNTYLIVQSATSQNYDLATVRDITFTDEGISVNLTSGKSQSFDYSSFSELRFTQSAATGIKGIADDTTPKGGEVFDLQGRKVAVLTNGNRSLSTLSLPKGIYIVRSGNKSVKVINR